METEGLKRLALAKKLPDLVPMLVGEGNGQTKSRSISYLEVDAAENEWFESVKN